MNFVTNFVTCFILMLLLMTLGDLRPINKPNNGGKMTVFVDGIIYKLVPIELSDDK